MFSSPKFIEASRQFVCIRPESYENEAAQKMVRSLLDGRFMNTAFCVFAPDGKRRLSRTGRAPSHGLSEGRGRGPGRGPGRGAKPSTDALAEKLNTIAAEYDRQGENSDRVLQDFLSYRQALNVASGDQRLLVYVPSVGSSVKETLGAVFSDPEVIGRFHLDLGDPNVDRDWVQTVATPTESSEKLSAEEQREFDDASIVIIQSGQFGLKGTVVGRVTETATAAQIKSALLEANTQFAKAETRKVYSEHVAEGRKQRVFFENEMPYGEDRDGDGEIDRRGGRPRGRR